MLRFGTDGVRGVALTELTEHDVQQLGRAAARTLAGDEMLVARDTRVSGPLLEAAFSAGAASEGMSVVSLGVLPTPALARLAADRDLPAAMVTASHNPYTDNGVKLFARGGRKLTDDAEAAVERVVADLGEPDGSAATTGRLSVDTGGADAYVTWLCDVVAGLTPLTVVIDCAHGAMSEVAPRALAALGLDVIVLNASPDGTNINDRCGATDPRGLADAVVAQGAVAGLAFDGDGDRVIAVDEKGSVVDGDRLIALAALDMRARRQLAHDTVVVTVMANLGFHRAMAESGVNVRQTAVGDRYVLEAMEAGGFSLGGEQSGHIIYRDLATTGDGLLAGAKLLELLGRADGTTLSELAGSVMTTFPQVLVNVPVAERHPHVADELATEITAASGLLGADGRVLVRASGTEPLVRVMVEASTEPEARRVAESLAEIVRARFA